MPTYKYRPFYRYNGPTHSQPFREQLAEEEIARRMSLFFSELGAYFDDFGAEIEPIGDGIIAVTADIAEAECDARVKRCLNSLDLYAQKIP